MYEAQFWSNTVPRKEWSWKRKNVIIISHKFKMSLVRMFMAIYSEMDRCSSDLTLRTNQNAINFLKSFKQSDDPAHVGVYGNEP